MSIPDDSMDEGLPISKRQIQALAKDWGTGALDGCELWEGVCMLARAAWAARQSFDDERRRAWHHFLMAVGNFKRQGGRRIRVKLPDAGGGTEDVTRGPELEVFDSAGKGFVLVKERLESWIELEDAILGVGTPTATAALAALWPDYHVIIDRRTLGAAVALQGVRDGWTHLEKHGLTERSQDGISPTMKGDYCWYRDLVAATARRAGVELFEVERALYELDWKHGKYGTSTTSWGDYARALAAELSATAPG